MKLSLLAMLALPVIMAGLTKALSCGRCDDCGKPAKIMWNGEKGITVTKLPVVTAQTVTVTKTITPAAPTPITTTKQIVREAAIDTTVTRTTTTTVTATDYAYKTGSGLILSTKPLRHGDFLTNYTLKYLFILASGIESLTFELHDEYTRRHDITFLLSHTEAAIKLLQQVAQTRRDVVAHVKIHEDDLHALRPGYILFSNAIRLLRTVELGLSPYFKQYHRVPTDHPLNKLWKTLHQLKKQNLKIWTAFETLGQLDDNVVAELTKKPMPNMRDTISHINQIILLALAFHIHGVLFDTFSLLVLKLIRSAKSKAWASKMCNELVQIYYFFGTSMRKLSLPIFLTISTYGDDPQGLREAKAKLKRDESAKVGDGLGKAEQKIDTEVREEGSAGGEMEVVDAEVEIRAAKKTQQEEEEQDGGDWIVVNKTGSEADAISFSDY